MSNSVIKNVRAPWAEKAVGTGEPPNLAKICFGGRTLLGQPWEKGAGKGVDEVTAGCISWLAAWKFCT